MSIAIEISKLTHDAIIELFVIDATALGGSVMYLHAGTNKLSQPVVWQGQAYDPFPIQADGFERNSSGPFPRPTLKVSNVYGLVGALVRDYKGLKGAKVTRRRTLAKYLDAVNFPQAKNLLRDTAGTTSWALGPNLARVATGQASPIGTLDSSVYQANGTVPASYLAKPFEQVAGTTYTVSLWARLASGTAPINGHLLSVEYNATRASLPYAGSGISSEWQRFWVTFTAGTNVAAAQTFLMADSTSAAQVQIWGVQAEAGTEPSDYQDMPGTWSANPSADPTAQYDDEVWYIDRRAPSDHSVVTFELASPMDVAGVMIPRRQVLAGVCTWGYRTPDCGYTGGAVAKQDDTPTSLMSEDACGHRPASCRLRAWPNNEIPISAFLGAGSIQAL
jgi:phage-related protein